MNAGRAGQGAWTLVHLQNDAEPSERHIRCRPEPRHDAVPTPSVDALTVAMVHRFEVAFIASLQDERTKLIV
jgi:hypothetical protein